MSNICPRSVKNRRTVPHGTGQQTAMSHYLRRAFDDEMLDDLECALETIGSDNQVNLASIGGQCTRSSSGGPYGRASWRS